MNRRSFLSFLPKAIAGMKLAPLVPVDPFSDWVDTDFIYPAPVRYADRIFFIHAPADDKLWWSHGVDVASDEDTTVVATWKHGPVQFLNSYNLLP